MKKAAALALATGMMVSATAMTASATSVSGSVSGYSCSGTNSISSSGAAAATYGGRSMMLYVKLTYQYIDNSSGTVKTIVRENSNSATSVNVSCSKPSGNTKSYRCQSTHTASYGTTWSGTTAYEEFF